MSIKFNSSNSPVFFFKKSEFLTNNTSGFLNDYSNTVELPLHPHPGSFGFVRKHHQHEGIDFYCMQDEPVFSILDGKVILIKDFTGDKAGSPWWNNTQMCLIDHGEFVINYGEISVLPNIKEGLNIVKGQQIGHVSRVLKKDKGRPRDMLHIEMYTPNTENSINHWSLNEVKPHNLLDPTPYFLKNFFS